MPDLHKIFSRAGAAVMALCLLTRGVCAEDAAAPRVSAESAILIETSGGNVIFEKDADTRRPMASTTKIMTALIALEAGDTSREVTVPGGAVGIEGSSVYLETGDRLSLDDLVWALMLESANDAAAAIAINVAGSVDAFAELMNAKAKEIGLENTHFTNPHGLDDEEHYTTARDLAKLAAYALSHPRFREIVSTYRHNISVGDETRYLLNHNKMLRLYDGAVGVKTGYTKRSGRCLVSAAERDGVTLVAVTLSAPDDWRDHAAMLDHGFTKYESRQLIRPGESVFIQPCIGCERHTVSIRNADGLTVCVPTTVGEVRRTVELPRYLWAPVAKGQIVGKIRFTADDGNGREITLGEVALYSEEDAPRMSYEKKGLLGRIFG